MELAVWAPKSVLLTPQRLQLALVTQQYGCLSPWTCQAQAFYLWGEERWIVHTQPDQSSWMGT